MNLEKAKLLAKDIQAILDKYNANMYGDYEEAVIFADCIDYFEPVLRCYGDTYYYLEYNGTKWVRTKLGKEKL